MSENASYLSDKQTRSGEQKSSKKSLHNLNIDNKFRKRLWKKVGTKDIFPYYFLYIWILKKLRSYL